MQPFIIVDTETTGLDPAVDQLVEVGAVLFDADRGVPIRAASELVYARSNAAAAKNGIPEDVVQMGWSLPRERVGAFFEGFESAARAVDEPIYLAHNAAFDRSFLPGIGGRWVCTFEDASWPRLPEETGSLTHIALAYGVGVVRAHRALEDCLTLAQVLQRVHELEGGLDGWLARALEPKREVIALVSYDDREKAKSAGFRWVPERKVWARKVRVSQVQKFCASLGFRTRIGG